jgi:hypothetical protein
MGMEGAFTSLADDSGALYWNPAGLSLPASPELAGAWSSFYNGVADQWWGAGVVPFNGQFAFGAGLTESVFEDTTEGSYALGFAYGQGGIHVGASVRFLLVTSDFEAVGGNGLGADIGALYRLPPFPGLGTVSFGVAVQDIIGRVWERNGFVQDLPTVIRGGMTYMSPLPAAIVLEIEHVNDPARSRPLSDAVMAGLEGWVFKDTLAIRAGARTNSTYLGIGVGASVRVQNVEIGYAYNSLNMNRVDITWESVFNRWGKHTVGLTYTFPKR